ncbi:GTP cyclohydrolase I FolE [Terrimonas sp. NA20]|uniref:GTP cyclohydrolase 1 n=1 Tax=Terrimonas ginsenosidimutans TaxID=2908004 RepID=A0ABS9KV97_9BACT|nr:GTP cyclohydrolase I FolE [Terrimonas ginsenosidimutans]MCG2616246.1 GTP cyclohydrolase I FolE [Terrimonas ginsenosidimutans]
MENGQNGLCMCKRNRVVLTDLMKEIGDNHLAGSEETPLRADAFLLSSEQKINRIAGLFGQVMETLGLDLNDDSLSGTPLRVAKMYVEEVFGGLDPANKPDVTLFDNKYRYDQMLVEKDITVYSHCEHHFVPIYGKAHVAYISSGKVIGLSKLNRLVDYYARRPQVQERLTVQIGRALQQILDTENVAIVIDAKHLCVASRGIRDTHSATVTSYYGGKFNNSNVKEEFLRYAGMTTDY